MKIEHFGLIAIALAAGYVLAIYFPGPGNALKGMLPGAS